MTALTTRTSGRVVGGLILSAFGLYGGGNALIKAATGDSSARSRAAASFAVMHVRHLLSELRVSGDLVLLSIAILAPLDIMVIEQQQRDHISLDRIEAGWDDLVRRVVGG